MDKEEILKKARNEKRDEGFDYARKKGLSFGYKIFLVLHIILLTFNILIGQNSYALLSLFWGFIGAESYTKYRFSKEKVELVSCVASSIACITFLVSYFLSSLR